MSFDPSNFFNAEPVAPTMADPETWDCYGAEPHEEGPQLFLFRAEAYAYAEGAISFHFRRYRAVRFTPCGAWVTEDPGWYDKPALRWVNTQYDGKRLGHVTKTAAVHSLKARKRRQVAILGWKLQCAEEILAAMKDVK